MKSSVAWAIAECGKLDPFACCSRREVQLIAARGMMSADRFQRICNDHGIDSKVTGDTRVVAGIYRYRPVIKALWREVKRRHPTARLVRVRITCFAPNGGDKL